MLAFDPTDERIKRSEAKKQIEISMGHSRHFTFDEDSVKVFRFWFIERSNSQEQSDSFKEDGIYAKYRVCE